MWRHQASDYGPKAQEARARVEHQIRKPLSDSARFFQQDTFGLGRISRYQHVECWSCSGFQLTPVCSKVSIEETNIRVAFASWSILLMPEPETNIVHSWANPPPAGEAFCCQGLEAIRSNLCGRKR